MALPSGVTTATVTVGVPVTHAGAPVKTFVSIEPSAFLVHAATGTPLVDFMEELDIAEGVAGQFTLPHTDQAGFTDENGNAYTNWYYTARVTYTSPSKAKVKAPKIKVFQLTTGQTEVDLDKLPGGAPALPYTAPTAKVDAFNGRTGAVTLLDADLPERLAETALNATYAPGIAKRSVKGQGDRTYALATSTTPQQARWVGLGDSVANLKMRFLFGTLNRAYGGGVPGASISAGQSGTGWGITGITSNVTTGTVTDANSDFDAWFSGYVNRYATGATRTYGIGGVSPYWDTAKVYYVKGATNPDGGTFKVQIDGVDEGSTIDTNNASISMGIVTITRGTVAQRELKVVNLTGQHRIIGVEFTNSKHGGLIYGGISQGGISLETAVSTAGGRANLGAYLAAFQPDVITLECKENSSYYAAALETLFGIIDTNAPKATVIGIGSTPILTGDADQVIQNNQLRTACDAHGNIFWDGYAPFGDYATLNGLGWAGDGTHVDDKASAFLAGMMIADLALLDAPGMKATRDNDMTAGRVRSKLDFGPVDQADAAALTNARFQPSSGTDLDLICKRTFNVMGSTGVSDANSWTMRPDNSGDQQIPNGVRVGAASTYLQSNSTGLLEVKSARGGGSDRDLKVRALVFGVQNKTAQSGAVTVDLSVATVSKVNLTGNMTSFAFSNPTAPGQKVVVWFVQDATGSRTAAGWSGSIVWDPALGAPTLSTGPNKRDRFEFEFLDGAYYETARTLNY